MDVVPTSMSSDDEDDEEKLKIQSTAAFNEMMLFYTRFLRLIAILRFEGRDFTYSVSRLCLAFFFTTSLLSWLGYMVCTIRESHAGALTIATLCETVVVVGMHLRYYVLLWHRQELADLLEESLAIWQMCDVEGQRAVRQFERKVRLLFQCLLGSCIFIWILYSSSAISLNIQAACNNRTERYLPFTWFTNGENPWLGYEGTFALQSLIMACSGTIGSTVDTVAPLFIIIGAGYFRSLRLRLHRAYDIAVYEGDKRADNELIACSQLHLKILEYCSRIDRITRTLFFVQLMTTGYNTSLIAIKLAGTDPNKYKFLPLGLLNMSQMFLCQWAPDCLIDESSAVSTAAYSVSVPWMKRRIGKVIVLIIARAQRPVHMTAAGIVYLSLETFTTIFKGAVSFFAVMRNFTA